LETKPRRILFSLLVIIGLAALGVWSYQNYLGPQPVTPTPQVLDPELQGMPNLVSAEGRVTPVQFARLGFASGGRVEAVLVSPGEQVAAGQPLARLEGRDRLEAALSAARLEQLSARQALDELKTSAEVAAAQALQAVADARDAVRDAEQRLNNLKGASLETDIDQARANKVLAEEKLERAREDFEPYENKPEDNLTRAMLQSRLAQAQKEYDAAARLLNNLLGDADEIDLEQAGANLALAQARLADAEREYAQLKDGPDPDDLVLAEARLENAAAQLQAAHKALEDLELAAPFAGTVVAVDLKVGESLNPGIPALTLADLSAWQIETIDLVEGDAALLAPGMTGAISMDAFPGQSFTGVVREIALEGEDSRGDLTYTVTLDFDPGKAPVRWGMTAFVDITLP
jgi:multidrug efflux pump subunit AcrA (membrane-fusion protein)